MVPDDADCPQFLKRKGASPTVNVRKRWVALTIDALPPQEQSRNKFPISQPDASARDRRLAQKSLADPSGCDVSPQENPEVISGLFLRDSVIS